MNLNNGIKMKFKDVLLTELSWNAMLQEIEKLKKQIQELTEKIKTTEGSEKTKLQNELNAKKRILSSYENIKANQAKI